jgi:hypothetical protein
MCYRGWKAARLGTRRAVAGRARKGVLGTVGYASAMRMGGCFRRRSMLASSAPAKQLVVGIIGHQFISGDISAEARRTTIPPQPPAKRPAPPTRPSRSP